MHLFIDASNLRRGGGVTHLFETLHHLEPNKHGIQKITMWGPQKTVERFGDLPFVEAHTHPWIDRGRIWGVLFRARMLDKLVPGDVDLLWAPGGTYGGRFRPYVTMLRNFLPFDHPERDRFRPSLAWLRLLYLERVQGRSFTKANGLIHISQEAHDVLNRQMDLSGVTQTVIHHGLSERFLCPPRPQRPLEAFTAVSPARLLYVSHINLYKHQDKLLQAVNKVRERGIPCELHLVGPYLPAAKRRFFQLVEKLDPDRTWVKWHREIPYQEVAEHYRNADLYTCTSTCETFGMVLLEAMGSGLPVLCSNRSALPEIQGGTGPSVDPEDIPALADAIEATLRDRDARERAARAGYERAKTFTWQRCADETFSFLTQIANAKPKT